MDYKEIYESWLSNPYFDEDTKDELRAIAEDENEIKERFYKELEFGTAGLRGIIGAGTNRMNIYTVRKTTQGLANYILAVNGQDKGVAIAYDSRRMSPEFANEAALCLAANGVKAYIFESLRPTPELSFALRKLGCIAGINITASHNPPEYNGYKVYWEDGAQITPPHDTGIMDEVQKVTDYNEVKTMSRADAEKAGLYQVIGQEVDDAYIAELKSQVLHMDAIKAAAKDLKIVYSPLHGTGNIPARRVLKELGFENVYVVKEQELPDGEFPTVSYPNPEAEEAFELGLKLAKEVDADLVLATDPDADRLGVTTEGKVKQNNRMKGASVGLAEVAADMASSIAKLCPGIGTVVGESIDKVKKISQYSTKFVRWIYSMTSHFKRQEQVKAIRRDALADTIMDRIDMLGTAEFDLQTLESQPSHTLNEHVLKAAFKGYDDLNVDLSRSLGITPKSLMVLNSRAMVRKTLAESFSAK